MIAAMSETYQRVREDSALYYLFERAQLIQEFKRKGALPPPLNVVSLVCSDLPIGLAAVLRVCRCPGLAALVACAPTAGSREHEISRDGFRLVPGPSQQMLLQRRLRLALRRCLKRQAAQQDEHLEHQVGELHPTLFEAASRLG